MLSAKSIPRCTVTDSISMSYGILAMRQCLTPHDGSVSVVSTAVLRVGSKATRRTGATAAKAFIFAAIIDVNNVRTSKERRGIKPINNNITSDRKCEGCSNKNKVHILTLLDQVRTMPSLDFGTHETVWSRGLVCLLS
jgi:hypothetical protein